MRGMIRAVEIALNAEAILNDYDYRKQTLKGRLKKTNDKEERDDLWGCCNNIAQRELGILTLLTSLNFYTDKDKSGKWVVLYNEVDDGHDADYEEQKGDCQWL